MSTPLGSRLRSATWRGPSPCTVVGGAEEARGGVKAKVKVEEELSWLDDGGFRDTRESSRKKGGVRKVIYHYQGGAMTPWLRTPPRPQSESLKSGLAPVQE